MSKKIFFGILITLVVLGIAGFVFRKISFRSPIVFLGEPLQVVTQDEKTEQNNAMLVETIVPDVAHVSNSMRRDISLFGNKRISIARDCEITPKNSILQIEEQLLIENNTKAEQYILIKDKTYIVPAKGYTLASFFEEGEHVINCGGLTTDAAVFIR